MPPKRKAQAKSASNKVKSLDVSAEEAVSLKSLLETSKNLELVSTCQLARVLGIRGGCYNEAPASVEMELKPKEGDSKRMVAKPKSEQGVVDVVILDDAENTENNGTENDDAENEDAKNAKGHAKATCKGMALDPACLCGLIPENDTKYRMAGLWSKSAKKTDDDADIPTKRTGKQNRAGLENLGNTCYINSVLQTLFSIEAFKQAVLEAWMHQEQNIQILEEAPHPVRVLGALKDIFVKLEVGPESVVDPAPLIEALRLDSSVRWLGGTSLDRPT